MNNMRQIGLAFRMWAMDNGDQYPFNVSTTNGGTLELCSRAADGLDRNSAMHFLVMSNELNTPRVLVCPADPSKHAALNWSQLKAANVTYQVHSGEEVNGTNVQEVLAICPIHRIVVLSDGSVKQVSRAQLERLLKR